MKTIHNTKIIGIDHGYGNMKTANFCFPTGITAYDHEPLFTADMLVYGGRYYLIGEGHKEFAPDKIKDEDYYVLTLASIAKESGLRHRAAQRYAEISVSDSRFSLCPAGCVSRYNKQGLCVPQKSPSQPESADSLGAQPPTPRKERCVWGKMFVLPSV